MISTFTLPPVNVTPGMFTATVAEVLAATPDLLNTKQPSPFVTAT